MRLYSYDIYGNDHACIDCFCCGTLSVHLWQQLGISLVSRPCPAFCHLQLVCKSGREGLVSFLTRVTSGQKDGSKSLTVRGCTRPRTVIRAKVCNLPHVSSWRQVTVVHTEYRVYSWLNMRNAACQFSKFFDFLIMSCLHEKTYQAVPVFHTASNRKLGGAWE